MIQSSTLQNINLHLEITELYALLVTNAIRNVKKILLHRHAEKGVRRFIV